ncbi:hypothetical protein ACFQYP_43485 [Nonomuraea antimicrobica]
MADDGDQKRTQDAPTTPFRKIVLPPEEPPKSSRPPGPSGPVTPRVTPSTSLRILARARVLARRWGRSRVRCRVRARVRGQVRVPGRG